jgi:hypothetical protein
MAGLFNTPNQVSLMEQQQRALLAQQNSQSPALAGGMFELGRNASLAAQRYGNQKFGDGTPLEQRSQAVQDAQRVQDLMQGTDFSKKESIYKKAKDLNEAGFTKEAAQVLSMMPAAAAITYGPMEERTVEVQNPDGSIKKMQVLGQPGTDGTFKRIDSVTSDKLPSVTAGNKPDDVFGEHRVRDQVNAKGEETGRVIEEIYNETLGRWVKYDAANPAQDPDTALARMNPELTKQVKVTGEQAKLIPAKFGNDPAVRSKIWFGGSTSAEDLLPYTGEIERIANMIKKEDRQGYLKSYQGSGDAQALLNETGKSDPEYLQQAYDLYVQSEGFKNNTDRGMTGKQAGEQRITSTPNLEQMRKNKELITKQRDAISMREMHKGGLVVQDPSGKGFNMRNITGEQAADVFSRLDGPDGTDEAIVEKLSKMGFDFSHPGALAYHKENWETMRSDPETTSELLLLDDDPFAQRSLTTRKSRAAWESNDLDSWGRIIDISWYIARLKQGAQSGQTKGRGPLR